MAETAHFIIKLRDKMSGPARKARKSIGGLEDKVRSADGRFKKMNFGQSMKKQFSMVAKGALLAGAALAVLATKSIIQTGAAFGKAISAVGAVGLKTREEISALEEKAKSLGISTKFTATEAAGAMEVMARAGFKTQEIMSGVDGVLAAAAASGLEIAEVANHVSNALKGMGLEANQTGRVADVLALAASRTNSSIGSLGESLKNVASTARQLNIPLEDTIAAVALLQDVGLDASVAGSAMNTMLTKMAAPTASITAKMVKFGVSFKDAKGDMLPFQEVLANVSKAAKASGGNMDRVAFLAELVGLRGQKAAGNLADLFDSGRVGKLTEELENAAGSAQKMADLKMDNLSGDVTLFQSALEGVQISLFESTDGMRDLVQSVTDWLREGDKSGKFVEILDSITTGAKNIWKWMSALVESTAETFAAFMGADDASEALETLGSKLSLVADYITVYSDEIATAFSWTGKILGSFLAFKLAVWAVTTAFGIMNAVMAINPFILLGMAIVGIIAAVWFFSDEIGAAFTAALGWMSGVVDDFKFVLSELWNFFADIGPSIGAALIDGILLALNPFALVKKIMSVGGAVIDAAKDVFGISSPSAEFEWIGKMNMEGIEGGMDKELPSVLRTTEGVANDTLSAGSDGAGNGAGSSGGGTATVNVTITVNASSPAEIKKAGVDVLDSITQAMEKIA